jgi:hypothetical protein
MKKWLYIGGGVVAVVGAAVVAVFLFSGSILKTIIEDTGSKATKAKVTLNDVSLSPMSGEGALKGLVVGNPAGFKSAQAFKLDLVSLKVDTSTITSDVILVKEVVIAGPDVTYELSDTGDDNIRTIQKNTQAFAGGGKPGGGAPAGKPVPGLSPEPAAKGEKEKKVVIENLYVRGGKVAVTATALGGKPLGTSLPDIHLTNIGKSSGGATGAEVAEQVIGAIAKAAQSAVSKIGADQLKGLAGGQADEMMKKLGTQVPAGLPAGLPGTGSQGGASGAAPAKPGGALDRLIGR